MKSTHFKISAREIGAKLKQHGSVCPPIWILTVEWSGARSCLFLMTSPFSDSIVFSVHIRKDSVFKKYRFQIAPLWRAFSNGSVFGDRFRRCSVNDSRIWNKTAPFSFENRLVWTGPKSPFIDVIMGFWPGKALLQNLETLWLRGSTGSVTGNYLETSTAERT